jgi:hypothetical protein
MAFLSMYKDFFFGGGGLGAMRRHAPRLSITWTASHYTFCAKTRHISSNTVALEAIYCCLFTISKLT